MSDSQAFLRELDKKLLRECGQLASTYKITSTGKLIDDALEAIERENVNEAERHGRPTNVVRRVRAGARINLSSRSQLIHNLARALGDLRFPSHGLRWERSTQ